MKYLAPVIWLVGYPLVSVASQFVNEYLCKNTYSVSVKGISAICEMIIWFGVFFYLMRKVDKKEK